MSFFEKIMAKNVSLIAKYAGAGGLLLLSVAILFWAFTRTDEERLIMPKTQVRGIVTYRGKPVPHALVILSGSSWSSTGQAGADGRFVVPNAPSGKVQVGINTSAGRGMMMGAIMQAAMSGDRSGAPSFVDVPEKYFSPASSGIEVDIPNTDGDNEISVVLK